MTLGELLSPGESNDIWANFNPEQWWWCYECSRVHQAKELRVRTIQRKRYAACPFCRSARHLWWFHGWPSLVLDRWRPFPRSGDAFYLPEDWQGDNGPEEPGTGQFRNGLAAVTK